MILSIFLIPVYTSLTIVVCSSAVDSPTVTLIVNKYHFYKTTAAISELLIHNSVAQCSSHLPLREKVIPATYITTSDNGQFELFNTVSGAS